MEDYEPDEGTETPERGRKISMGLCRERKEEDRVGSRWRLKKADRHRGCWRDMVRQDVLG